MGYRGKLFCYRCRAKNLFETIAKSVASEKYFYETFELSPVDVDYLKGLIGKASHKGLQDINRRFVQLFQLSFLMRERIKNSAISEQENEKLCEQLRVIEKTVGESYHANIERNAQHILDSLRRGDDSFYSDSSQCSVFMYFLTNQYFRTPRMRALFESIPNPLPGLDLVRTGVVECHIYAANVGAGLFLERNNYGIIFLVNNGRVPFITGDQPVINMKTHKDTDVELFYPLSPKRAMLLTKDASKLSPKERNVSVLEVENYNYAIYSACYDQVYSNDRSYLGEITSLKKGIFTA
ncbi:DUF4238 domain-containing protein [Methylocystis sp. IM2]|uniref:DUF4238 domain-containing protein n=1 Tax=unclassified Methylocystis TaxID=2625913 RepID=UPI0030FC0801